MEKLVRNLRILGNLPKYGRLKRSYEGVVALEDNSFYTAGKRFFRCEGREQTLRDIRSVVAETEERVVAILHSRYLCCQTPEANELRQDLEALRTLIDCAIEGVDNLKTTYASDLTVVAELDVLGMRLNRVSSKTVEALGRHPSGAPAGRTVRSTHVRNGSLVMPRRSRGLS